MTQITRMIVRDTPPPNQVVSVGRIYPLYQPKPEEDEKSFDEDAELKVVRRGRRPKPKANEDAEVK